MGTGAPIFHNLKGGCMRPLIRDGEILPIRPAGGVEAGLGDVILYRNDEKTHVHRVWWRAGESLWVKDDTGTVALHKVPQSAVLGILDERRPLSRGWLGLSYSMGTTFVFMLARFIRKILP